MSQTFMFIIVFLSLYDVILGDRGGVHNIKINEPRNNGGSNNINTNNNNNNGNTNTNTNTYRDPNIQTTNNNIVFKDIIDKLSNKYNALIETKIGKYTYKLKLFNMLTQHEDWNQWNIGIFDKWDFCNNNKDTLCLIYNDGQTCGNGNKREINIELTCQNKDNNDDKMFDFNEPETCKYQCKLYLHDICKDKGSHTIFLAKDKDKIFDDNKNSDSTTNTENTENNNNDNNNNNNKMVSYDMTTLEKKLDGLIENDKQYKICLLYILNRINADNNNESLKSFCNLYLKTIQSELKVDITFKDNEKPSTTSTTKISTTKIPSNDDISTTNDDISTTNENVSTSTTKKAKKNKKQRKKPKSNPKRDTSPEL